MNILKILRAVGRRKKGAGVCCSRARQTQLLKNGSGEGKRFFCRQCVQQKHASGSASHMRGATQFLKRAKTQ